MRPRETSFETGTGSALAATAASGLEALLQVVDGRLELLVAPGLAHGGHRVQPAPEERRQRRAVREQRALGDRRPDVALAGKAVAARAHALEGLAAHLGRRREPSLDPRVVLAGRHHPHVTDHGCVLDAAELGALAAEGAELRRAEGLAIDPAGDCVQLPPER